MLQHVTGNHTELPLRFPHARINIGKVNANTLVGGGLSSVYRWLV